MGLKHIRRILCAAPLIAAPLITAAPLAADNPGSSNADGADAQSIEGLTKPAMSASDLITMPRLGSPTVTNNGRYAVYSVTYTDAETLERSPKHYLLDLETPGAGPVEFNLGLAGHSMRFGPDDFLYFVSSEHTDEDAEPRARVWRVALEANGNVTGPMLVADMPSADIAGFKLAPSGDKIALWAEMGRNCADFGCIPETTATGSGRLYEGNGGFYRHWDQWVEPDILSRVFVFGLENGAAVGGGVPADGGNAIGNTPTRPFGGSEDIAWAPGGLGLYFVARRSDSREPTSTDLDIYWSDLSGAAPAELTAANKAHDSSPAPSPDGKTLAYLAMERPGYEADRMVVQLRDLESGETRALTAGTDLSFGSLSWTHDGTALLATATDVLDVPAYRIDPKTGAVTKLNLIAGNEAHIGALTALPGNRLLFTRDSIGAAKELYLADLEAKGSAKGMPLTDIVTSRMGALASTVTTRFSFEGAGGDTVWGQITKLENQEGPVPAILYIHGGPQGSFLDGWSSRWNPRVVASQGYAVISVDFHGSAGYGQEFMDAINQDWGGKPLEDLQKGLAAALELDPQIDGTRTCAMGASYGGYMVNWIAGNWPERFDCLVQHDGLFDMRSFYYSTEELWFPRWDFGGSYAEKSDVYERWNPANHVDKWQTPMLVIAGERDFRVPYTQGLQSFTALQEREIPSQLLVFPDENHWVLGAANSLQWHETVFTWLDRWLKAPDKEIEQK